MMTRLAVLLAAVALPVAGNRAGAQAVAAGAEAKPQDGLQAEPAASDGLHGFVHPPVNFRPGSTYGPEARKYQGIPSLERSPGGRLWAVWYAGKEHEDRYNYVVGVTSADDGETWSDLKWVIDPDGDGPMRTSDPCLWLDPAGTLWLFWWLNGPGRLATVTMAMTTANPDDEDPAWTEPRVICNGVMLNKPIVVRNGDWLLPTAIWQTDNSCRVVASVDQGRTWTLRGAANVPDPADRNCDEPMLVQRGDGKLMMLVRTRYGIGSSLSPDDGRTWTPVAKYLPDATSRFFLRRLHSGNLLLVKHGPLDKRIGRTHLTAYVSSDDGKTWQGGLLLDERATVSYPDGTQAPDGALRVIYDWNRADDKHILLAAFTEQDVLAGRAVSAGVRLRVLVNQATGVNPKPWLKDGRFLQLKQNADGAPFQDTPTAVVEPADGEIRTVELNKPIFSNRAYAFHKPPTCLLGKHFVFGRMEGVRVVCRSPGVVYVLTPAPERNRDSASDVLTKEGFARVALAESILFLSADGQALAANAVTVFQKEMKAGDTLECGKWAVVAF